MVVELGVLPDEQDNVHNGLEQSHQAFEIILSVRIGGGGRGTVESKYVYDEIELGRERTRGAREVFALAQTDHSTFPLDHASSRRLKRNTPRVVTYKFDQHLPDR